MIFPFISYTCHYNFYKFITTLLCHSHMMFIDFQACGELRVMDERLYIVLTIQSCHLDMGSG